MTVIGIRIGVPGTATKKRGGGLPAGDIVIGVYGDSNMRGSALDQAAFAAAYTPDPYTFALNASGAWAQYVPGTFTGLSGLANTTWVGPEIGFIRRFRALYPTRNLYIAKMSQPGAFQGVGPAIGTFTGSCSGNQITVTAPSTLAPTNVFDGVVGPVFGRYCYAASGTGPFFVSEIGVVGNPGLSDPSEVRNKFNGTLSFSSDKGLLYNGIGGNITSGYRNRLLVGLAALSNPVVLCIILGLGTNDKVSVATATPFGAELTASIARQRSDWPLTNTKIILPRVRLGNEAATVRAAQDAVVAGDPKVYLIETDDLPIQGDNTHYDTPALDSIGSRAFDVAVVPGGEAIVPSTAGQSIGLLLSLTKAA